MAVPDVNEPRRRGTKDEAVVLIAPNEIARRREALLEAIAQRAYELFEERGGVHGYHLEDWLRAERELTRLPQWTLLRERDGARLLVEVPGFSPDQIKLYGCEGALLLEAHLHEASPVARLGHPQFGRDLYQFIPLPEGLAVSRATLDVEHGILQVQLPFAGVRPSQEASGAIAAATRPTAEKRSATGVKASPRVAAKSTPSRSKVPKKKPSTPSETETPGQKTG